MIRLYTYRLRIILRDRVNLFWTLAFPLLMATFFWLAFGSLTGQVETLQTMPVAVVEQQANPVFSAVLDSMAQGDGALLSITNTDDETAQDLLAQGDVVGIITLSDTPDLTVKAEGTGQSLLKAILDRTLQGQVTGMEIAKSNPLAAIGAVSQLSDSTAVTRRVTLSGGSLDFMLEYFYALIGMACLFGGFFGLNAVHSVQGSQSPLGARRSITPTSKTTMVLADTLASLTISFAEILILIAYMTLVLGIGLGSHWPAVLLLCLMGCACGVMLGVMLGAVLPFAFTVKEGVLIAGSLLCSFLAGMMYNQMRYIVEEYVPFLNRINPASLITDAFYALDAYGVGARYWIDMGWMLLLVVVMATASILVLRRKQYASV